MNQIFLALAGPKGVGKSSVAKELVKIYRYATIVKFAQPVRDMLAAIGIHEPPYEEKETKLFYGKTYRELMVSLGTGWGRDMVAYNIWAQIGMERAKALPHPVTEILHKLEYGSHLKRHLIIFDDCRFENEAVLVNGAEEPHGFVIEITGRSDYVGGATETRLPPREIWGSISAERTIYEADGPGVATIKKFDPHHAAMEILDELELS